MNYQRFDQLPLWQAARRLARSINIASSRSELSRDWGLRDQLKSAAVSVMANISEGFHRRSDKEFIHFLFVAKASNAELQSHLYAAMDRGYLDEDAFSNIFSQAEGVAKQISGLLTYLIQCNRSK